MRIKRIELENYKRFSKLVIDEIPEAARLVVLIGPNGSGKSSLFDSFLLKSQSSKSNQSLTNDEPLREYYVKDAGLEFAQQTRALAQGVKIEFHGTLTPNGDLSTIFNIRSAYRVEADFLLTNIQPVSPAAERARFPRIIDPDQAVSDNYRRLAWRRQSDLDSDAPAATTFGQYRREALASLQDGMRKLFDSPSLELQDFGGIKSGGAFRFAKGQVSDFHYKNLSGGEKAAFDILLDIFVKSNEYKDAIYCIDEPEDYIGTALHGRLLEVILDMMPKVSQLWVATHSIGFVRKAYELMQAQNNVAFLDFSGRNFDESVTITPCVPGRSFWQTTYREALDDLADLIAPSNIVICEGKEDAASSGFDAECYNRIFGDSHPDTVFVSRGGAKQVEKSEVLIAVLQSVAKGTDMLIAVLQSVAKGTDIWRLIDRDEMAESAREEKIQRDIRVLRRRELENYLFAPEVLSAFCKGENKEGLETEILGKAQELLNGGAPEFADLRPITRELLRFIKLKTQLQNLGNDRREFALEHLAPALRETPNVFQELEEDIFSR